MAPTTDYETLREQGRQAARQAITDHAPADALERVAWVAGFGQEDQLRAAVDEARQHEVSWAELAKALGLARSTVQTRFGTGYERQRKYRQRLRDEG